MSRRCHDCKHLALVWRCTVPLPMHMENMPVDGPSHDTHSEDCDCFERREGRTSDLRLALTDALQITKILQTERELLLQIKLEYIAEVGDYTSHPENYPAIQAHDRMEKNNG